MKELLIFLAGVVFGAGLALFLAPESGEELRSGIRSRVDEEIPKLRAELKATMEKTNTRLSQIEADLKKKQNRKRLMERNNMNEYEKITAALVDAGYLSSAEVEAALDILADALVVEDAEELQEQAAEDFAEQEDLLAQAQVQAKEDAVMGDNESVVLDEEIIEDAVEQMETDKTVMAGAEAVIDAACVDAAAALLAAELIDETNLHATEALIHQYRCG